MKPYSAIISTVALLALAGPAQAYIGPGAGISVVGSLLGLLGTILLAVGVIFLWPLRKLFKKGTGKDDVDTEELTDAAAPVEGEERAERVSDN